MKKFITSAVFAFARLLAPLLIRVLPQKVLKAAKKRFLRGAQTDIGAVNAVPFLRSANDDGVNLIGPIFACTGLGQSCRLLAEMITAAGVELNVIPFSHLGTQTNSKKEWGGRIEKKPSKNINIIHINAQDFPFAYSQLGKSVWDRRYNIGFWLWETMEFPDEWLPSFNLVDEIWTPSEFVSSSFRKVTDKPVFTLPYAITEVPTDPQYNRAYYGLPDDVFLFLCVYDSASVNYRKNPMGVIKSYKQAFGKRPENLNDVGIIIKVGHAPQEELDSVKKELSGCNNVYFITDELTRTEINSLIKCVDAYISLHRAEGFGLVCAEAMALGKPVIATNWSANAEFMSHGSSCLVDYELVPLEKDYPPFPKGTIWAEPNITHAAEYLRKLYEDRAFRAEVSENAKRRIADVLSMDKACIAIKERIKEILCERG